jgi:hypothetical protein
VSNPGGTTTALALSLRLIPEPATATLFALAIVSIVAIGGRHRCNLDEDVSYAS